ncbi:MAG TPA: hypothetical protein VJZ72_03575 [Candidatus Limnocylindrales bacterium]|nr:hypothetical protein [Candidatus Limnocylindrales bacterium]
MQSISVILSVRPESVDEFERGFREQELPIWEDFQRRGTLLRATLARLDISSHPVDGAVQYLISVLFAGPEGHHEHDEDPRFEAWNKRADAYQLAEGLAFGGDVIISLTD